MLDAWGQVTHPKMILTTLFFVGILFRFFIRGDKAKRSPLRAYPTRRAFWVNNWSVFLIRTALVNVWLFIAWMVKPDILTAIALRFHVPPSYADWLVIPPNPLTAPLGGLWVDVLVDQAQMRLGSVLPSWVPDALKGEIPNYDSEVVVVDKLSDGK